MNDPVFDLAIFYVYWFAIAYALMRLWEGRHRIMEWLVDWNWRRW